MWQVQTNWYEFNNLWLVSNWINSGTKSLEKFNEFKIEFDIKLESWRSEIIIIKKNEFENLTEQLLKNLW